MLNSGEAALTSIRIASVMFTLEEADVMIHCGFDEPSEPEPVFLFPLCSRQLYSNDKIYLFKHTLLCSHSFPVALFREYQCCGSPNRNKELKCICNT